RAGMPDGIKTAALPVGGNRGWLGGDRGERHDRGEVALRPPMRRHTARRNLNKAQMVIHMSTTTSASNTANSMGCCVASHKAATTTPSSTRLMPMLEKGSGEVLMAARVLVLAAWLVAASVPPS